MFGLDGSAIQVPATLPDDIEPRLEAVVAALHRDDTAATVRTAVAAAMADLPDGLVDVETVDGQVGISITDHADHCLAVRLLRVESPS